MKTVRPVPESYYSIAGLVMLILGLAGVTAFMLFIWQSRLAYWHIAKHIAWTVWGCLFLLALVVVTIANLLPHRSWQKKYRQVTPQTVIRKDEGAHELALITSGSLPPVEEIRQSLYKQYGRCWRYKVRILLLTGSVDDIEQLTPGLSNQYWQEDGGTLLLWGGTPEQPTDSAWLKALSKRSHRPADGIVWVTSGLSEGVAPPSEESMDNLTRAINERYVSLGWLLPVYVWSLHPEAASAVTRTTQAVGCLLPVSCRSEELNQQLQLLIPELISQGIQQVSTRVQFTFLLLLADQLDRKIQSISKPLSPLLNSYRSLPLAGILFSPPTADSRCTVKHHWNSDNRWGVIPASTHALPVGLRPRRTGIRWRKAVAVTAAALLGVCSAGLVVSFVGNRSLISDTHKQVELALMTKQSVAERLQALSEVQKTLLGLQRRAGRGVPWYLHAGLSQNNTLLDTIFTRYEHIALPLLRDVAADHLQQRLATYVALPANSPQRSRLAKAAYDQLKLYLMLAHPERMDAAWFSKTLLRDWPQRKGVASESWQAFAPALLTFYGAQLLSHPQWKLQANVHVVGQIRAQLVHQIKVRNSDNALYQKMLTQVAHLYTELHLSDITGEAVNSRLFTTDATVPGMFTRQAWEETVQPAIDKVVKGRFDGINWVLCDGACISQPPGSDEALKQRLTARYFADFGGAWLAFLNSLQWHHASTLSDAIDQLILLVDVRLSPLLALMNTLNVQGSTGRPAETIADLQANSAGNLQAHVKTPVIDKGTNKPGPLDAIFGPVLAFMDSSREDVTSLSLQTFLARVTQLRLQLQQVANAPDVQAMSWTQAQPVFQGKTMALTEICNYGSRMAAELGPAWSGFAQTLFVRPVEQAWQQVLRSAAESLNAQWRASLVDEWNSSFGNHYPFKNVSGDASLVLLADFLSIDSGRIARFLQSNLNGVLRYEARRWVPVNNNVQGLDFNRAFLHAMNTLSQVADGIFAGGEARLHFDLRPGTAEGVMRTDLTIDGHKLTYVNQMPAWERFSWPADTTAPGAILNWVSTRAGTRQFADLPGNWGLIRLLDMAEVEPWPGGVNSFRLRWTAPDGRPLNYRLRTEAGAGPLALLKLRNFTLPDTVFDVNAATPADGEDSAGVVLGDYDQWPR